MFRALILAMAGLGVCSTSSAQTPQLTGRGMLATGTTSRTRLGGEHFQLGDLMYVMALQPASIGEIYISAHMEYRDTSGQWRAVPTANTLLGREYTSGRYVGLRDYVRFAGVTQNTERHVSLFIPYDAAGLADGQYTRRYVIRLWDRNNHEVGATALPGEAVAVQNQPSRTTITVVHVRACNTMEATEGPPEPVAESVSTGTVQFFDARGGRWVCP